MQQSVTAYTYELSRIAATQQDHRVDCAAHEGKSSLYPVSRASAPSCE